MKKLVQFAGLLLVALLPAMVQAADLAILQNGYEIRHEQREVMGATTRLYLRADRQGGYVDVPTEQILSIDHDESVREEKVVAAPIAPVAVPTKPIDIGAAVERAGKTHFIDPDFINSVILAESSFNPRAVSPKGAQGLMQLMPDTASKLGVKDSFDPLANVDGGTRYLRELLLRYNDDPVRALAAYNAGPQRVDQYHGVPPYRETRQYVARIIRDYNKKKLAAKVAKTTKPPVSRNKIAASGTAATKAGGSK